MVLGVSSVELTMKGVFVTDTTDSFMQPTLMKRIFFFLAADVLTFSFSYYMAFLLRFGFIFPDYHTDSVFFWLPLVVSVKIVMVLLIVGYNISWRFVGMRELRGIFSAMLLGSVLILIVNLLFLYFHRKFYIPIGVVIIDFMLSFLIVSFVRISKRFIAELLIGNKRGKKTLIIGAGKTGEKVVREFLRYDKDQMVPIGFIDDDVAKKGLKIHGIPVVGTLDSIDDFLNKNNVEALIIAVPSMPHQVVREVYEKVRLHHISQIKIVPSLQNADGGTSVKQMKDLNIEDLLYRSPVEVDYEKISMHFKNKTILVTGAGGSIGSEIARQIAQQQPKHLILLDIDETELYDIQQEMKIIAGNSGTEMEYVVCDIRNENKLNRFFDSHSIDIIFQAAAYKHVPLMESFPEEAVSVNILGVGNLVKCAVDNNVSQFVNISTDKAVNPTSVMGATKRVAEMICSAHAHVSKTKFSSVRFGNVLGSRGSVIPLFLKQIEAGGPVTVTHPEMKRYFMSIPEAVLLVMQSAVMGKSSDVFVLDMGDPIFISKLAEDLIRLNGYEPGIDIEIIYNGLRPGEKLFEELLMAEEGSVKTEHEKIFTAIISAQMDTQMAAKVLKRCKEVVNAGGNINELLKEYVTFYQVS